MIWNLIAKFCARPAVANWIIRRAMRTPDAHLPGYMERFWLFNRYNRETRVARYPRIPFSIRVHHILRADEARDHHDHPWDARTVILKDGYDERRLLIWKSITGICNSATLLNERRPGDTATINYGEYHTIDWVPPQGAWTLFIMYKYRGDWGFLVNGVKVSHTDYEKLER